MIQAVIAQPVLAPVYLSLAIAVYPRVELRFQWPSSWYCSRHFRRSHWYVISGAVVKIQEAFRLIRVILMIPTNVMVDGGLLYVFSYVPEVMHEMHLERLNAGMIYLMGVRMKKKTDDYDDEEKIFHQFDG